MDLLTIINKYGKLEFLIAITYTAGFGVRGLVECTQQTEYTQTWMEEAICCRILS